MLHSAFAVTTPFVLPHLARHNELPTTPWGFRALSGPFERLGPETFTPLGWALVGVCALGRSLFWPDGGACTDSSGSRC
jgi:hypothetical protein